MLRYSLAFCLSVSVFAVFALALTTVATCCHDVYSVVDDVGIVALFGGSGADGLSNLGQHLFRRLVHPDAGFYLG